MIRNETPLEELFYNMLEEMRNDMYGENGDMLDISDYQNKNGNPMNLAIEVHLNEIYRFMHNAPKSDNPSGICQFVLGEQRHKTPFDTESDEFLPPPFTESHQKDFQKFCDLYAKDGFKFKVTLNPMSLLWTKDGKVINRDNFDEINNELQKNNN